MNTPNHTRSNRFPILTSLLTLSAIILSSAVLYGQDSEITEDKSAPVLSETTLKILEAHAQSSLQSPTPDTPEESQLRTKKPRKLETGGLLKEWFTPFERKKKEGEEDPESDSKKKRTPIWKWFDPTAPLTETEKNSKPIDWRGSRTVPQSFGSPQKTDPEGLKLFFIRYK